MKKLLANKKFQLGFTLIELLIVVTIISILIAIGAVSYTTAQIRARNSQRQSDLQKISIALEAFYADYHQYPASQALMKTCLEGTGAPTCTITVGTLPSPLNVYLRSVPTDPQVSTTNYTYVPTVVGTSTQSFTLSAPFEGTAPAGYNPLNSVTH